jgi:hypothetical protein
MFNSLLHRIQFVDVHYSGSRSKLGVEKLINTLAAIVGARIINFVKRVNK